MTEARSAPSGEAFSPSDLPRRVGRYTLLRRLAKGGMGEVFLAASLGLEGAERPVIVKMIRSEHRADASFKARFLDEARVQAQLTHSGVVQVLDATTDLESGEPFVALEFVEGRSLGELRQRAQNQGTRIAWHEAVSLAGMAAEALAFVHERVDASGRPLGIVHRDLSPQNLMVSYSGEVKIIDFGTARGENRRCHTVSGVVYAKPGYTAPEVANDDPGDHRVDIYALGVMLWELCAGRRFLSGDSAEHMALVGRNEKNLPPIADEVSAPPFLDEVLEKLTSFDREQRYGKTRHAARDLASLLQGTPSLENGERGMRARVNLLMDRLFPDESTRSRREFARLVTNARKTLVESDTPVSEISSQRAHEIRQENEGLLPGTRYRVVGSLGEGAENQVLEATHVDIGTRVALKIAKDDKDGASERIKREARILVRLSGASVPRLIDVGQTSDGRSFLVLEKCEGETLGRALSERGGVFPEREALELGRSIAVALGTLHARDLVHRDIKPENIIVSESGAITILDLGIALFGDEAAMLDLETPPPREEVMLFGTPEYMAPEQVARGRADARSDIYALGSMLYQMLVGRVPFPQASASAMLEAKVQGSPEPMRERAKARGIPEAVDEVVLRALARHATLRFQNTGELIAAIDGLLAAPSVKREKRRKLGAVVVGVVMASALGLVALRAPAIGDAIGGAVESAKARLSPSTVNAVAEPVADVRAAPETPSPVADAPPAPLVAEPASTSTESNGAQSERTHAKDEPEALAPLDPDAAQPADSDATDNHDTIVVGPPPAGAAEAVVAAVDKPAEPRARPQPRKKKSEARKKRETAQSETKDGKKKAKRKKKPKAE